jgi:predicted GNAT family acetyltransferase
MTIDLTEILRESMPTFSEARLGRIVKGGPGSGRQKESGYSQAIRYFSTNGGKVALATDKTQYTNDLKAFLSAHPDSDGAIMALEALSNTYAFVATSNGKAVGALGFSPYANTVKCSFFGTTGEVRGAGASLAQALFQYASDNGFSIRLEPSGEGEDFWGDLGKKDSDGWLMTDEDGYLDWNPAEVKAVASEVFLPVSKGGKGSGRHKESDGEWVSVPSRFGEPNKASEITAPDGTKFTYDFLPNGEILAVKGERGKFEFENETLDYHDGQTDYRTVAWLPNADGTRANAVAQIHYSEYQGTIHIQMVETNPKVQGQGLATTLYSLVALANPHMPIDDGYLTDDGAKWRNSQEVADQMKWAESLKLPISKGGDCPIG